MNTVLLIEDNLEIASLLRLIISRGGHRVLLAASLAEAEGIWSASKSEIDLLVTDNALPDGSGITYAERLHREKPTLKVIVVSGMPGPGFPPHFLRLDKPFQMAAFLNTLELALAGKDSPPPGTPPFFIRNDAVDAG